jgi:hypothetical protein
VREQDASEVEPATTAEAPKPGLLESVDFVALFLVLAWMFGAVLRRLL